MAKLIEVVQVECQVTVSDIIENIPARNTFTVLMNEFIVSTNNSQKQFNVDALIIQSAFMHSRYSAECLNVLLEKQFMLHIIHSENVFRSMAGKVHSCTCVGMVVEAVGGSKQLLPQFSCQI